MTTRLMRLLVLCAVLAVLLPTVVEVRAVAPGNSPFQRTWARTDRPVAERVVSRTWMWGPEANSPLLLEDYAETSGAKRVVQYYDKSRMEINDPDGNVNDPFYVTNGLLVVELISGRLQIGDDEFVDRAPASVNVAGDADDPTGPTYATFGLLRSAPAREIGQPVTGVISRDGTIVDDPSLAMSSVTTSMHVSETNHTVASPFWEFMTSSGTTYADGQYVDAALFANPFYATGLPISEAYWADVEVGNVNQKVLIQCFERRCLTFTPGNPAGFETEAGNVGQHYYAWRYADVDPTPAPSTPGVPSSGTWRQLQPAGEAPAARRDHGLVADADGSHVYLFGGRSGFSALADFWVYDVAANTWRVQAGGPAARFGHNVAFDTTNDRVIVFGGQNDAGFLSDVWAWHIASGVWTQLEANNAGPLDRYGAGGAYDSATNAFVISHGFTSDGRFDDTWSYDLTTESWVDDSAAGQRPEARCLVRTAIDNDNQRMLLFGGQSNTSGFLGDLWQFDFASNSWTQLGASGPSARNLYALATSDSGDFMLVHGGATAAGNSDQLWAFNFVDDTWSQVTTNAGPGARHSHDTAWLAGGNALLLLGGNDGSDLSDLWVFEQ